MFSIHSWAVSALGVKMDVTPGRLNQTRFFINRSGLFYGAVFGNLRGKPQLYTNCFRDGSAGGFFALVNKIFN